MNYVIGETGDFNIHIFCAGNTFEGEFLNLTESFNFHLHSTGPIHPKGYILDLVISCGVKTDNVEHSFLCFWPF